MRACRRSHDAQPEGADRLGRVSSPEIDEVAARRSKSLWLLEAIRVLLFTLVVRLGAGVQAGVEPFISNPEHI